MSKNNRNLHPNQETPLSKEMQLSLASLRLESIELSSFSLADAKLFDAGKITKDEFLKRAIGRAK